MRNEPKQTQQQNLAQEMAKAKRARLLAIGQQFTQQTRLEEAHGLYIALLHFFPKDVEIRLHLGFICREMGDLAASTRNFEAILAQEPHHIGARAGLALNYFLQEDWAKAWENFAVRFSLMDKEPQVSFLHEGQRRAKPPWNGQDPVASLLVMNEQGLGDTLQFARFLPRLVQKNREITFIAPRQIHHLLRKTSEGIVLCPQEARGQIKVQGWLPLMHIPHVLGLNVVDYQAQTPYLDVEPQKKAEWRAKIGTKGFKIGISWQGNPAHNADKTRSCPLEAFAPLADIPQIRLISLQKGVGEAQIATCSFKDKLEIYETREEKTGRAFEDTAAIMQQLDMVVSVDTSINHLAGALHVPCALLLMRLGADWRWLARQKDTVWYPKHRLYRQTKQGDWTHPIAQLADDLRVLQQKTAQENVEPSSLSLPFVSAPELAPSLLAGEALEKLLKIEASTQISEDVQELTLLLRQRQMLQEYVLKQNLSPVLQTQFKDAFHQLEEARRALKRQPQAQAYWTALSHYEAVKNALLQEKT